MPSFIKLESGRLLNLDLVRFALKSIAQPPKYWAVFDNDEMSEELSADDFAAIERLYCVPSVSNKCEPGFLAKLKTLDADVAGLANKADERSRMALASTASRYEESGRFDAYCAVQTMLSTLIKELEQ